VTANMGRNDSVAEIGAPRRGLSECRGGYIDSMPAALILGHAQFAFTISFHFIFPALIVAALSGAPAPVHAAAPPAFESADTKGNAVSVTYTINNAFGAKVIAGDTGFFLNDEMDDFTAKPGAANLFGLVQGKANSIAPGKRPLSSMTPTIVLRDGKPVLVVGAPGGSRIITTVLQIIVNVIDHGMALQEAVDAPRMHHQWLPDTLAAEPFGFSADTVKSLTQMGYHVVPLEIWGSGNAGEAIGIAPSDAAQARALGFPRPGLFYGASDSRARAGSAAAP
jgi:gamma-glutamyltranspeptidase / glutathione hydrolase